MKTNFRTPTSIFASMQIYNRKKQYYILTIKHVIENSTREEKPTFKYPNKAFGAVPRNKVWRILKEKREQETLKIVIQDQYKNAN